jgi:hypothetical protein
MTMNVIGVDICGLAPQPQLNHCNTTAAILVQKIMSLIAKARDTNKI